MARKLIVPVAKLIVNPTIVMLIEVALEGRCDCAGDMTEDRCLDSLRAYGAAEVVLRRWGPWSGYEGKWSILRFAYALPVGDCGDDAAPATALNTYTIDGSAHVLWTAAVAAPFNRIDLLRFPFPRVVRRKRS